MTSTSARMPEAAVGLIGVGYIADFHARAIALTPGVRLAAVCDVSIDRARGFAERHGVAQSYASGQEMLDRASLDAVHVLTPPQLHRGLARDALEAGLDVLVEKPLTSSLLECNELIDVAATTKRSLGISHNFLFSPSYERLEGDLQAGTFGPVDHVDIVWNKPLDQLRGGPYSPWMFDQPENILFEVAPHSFAHAVRLIGMPEEIRAHAWDEVVLPGDRRFFRRWEMLLFAGGASARLRFCFAEGYTEHYIHLRGAVAAAHVDFEQAIYNRMAHTPYMMDVDRLALTAGSSVRSGVQALANFGELARTRLGLGGDGTPYERSINRAVATFHETRDGVLDARLGARLGTQAVQLAERVAECVEFPAHRPRASSIVRSASEPQASTTLVIGGGGFIGRALVRRLANDGVPVRVLLRDPSSAASELQVPGVEVVRGDMRDRRSLEAHLDGITSVVHLGRGSGKTWADYIATDVEPTRDLAELCAKMSVQRLIYSSSIAIYDAGRRGETIDDTTRPMPSPADPYARSKVENERQLHEVAHHTGLGLVIVRPGVVLGRGASPFHWGIAAWPANSVARLWGDGGSFLPAVLVDDCADGIARALRTSGVDGRSFNLVGPPLITGREYIDELGRYTGVRIRCLEGPAWRHFLSARTKWHLKAAAGNAGGPPPRYVDSRARNLSALFDTADARGQLGWQPTENRSQLITEGIHVPADGWIAAFSRATRVAE